MFPMFKTTLTGRQFSSQEDILERDEKHSREGIQGMVLKVVEAMKIGWLYFLFFIDFLNFHAFSISIFLVSSFSTFQFKPVI